MNTETPLSRNHPSNSGQSRKDEDVAALDITTLEHHKRCLTKGYLLLWVIALMLSIFFLLDSPILGGGSHQEGKTTALASSSSTILDSIQYDLKDVRKKVDNIEKHFSSDILRAALQWVTVILISWLWFVTFRLKGTHENIEATHQRRGEVAAATPAHTAVCTRKLTNLLQKWPGIWLPIFSLVPAGMFAVAMHDQYNPAVFAMALVAVFVAAEHYGGLREQQEVLDRSHQILGIVKTHVNDLEDKSRNLSRRMDVMLNSGGLLHRKKTIYKAYHEAGSISAVVRVFDMDVDWWRLAAAVDGTQSSEDGPPSDYGSFWSKYWARVSQYEWPDPSDPNDDATPPFYCALLPSNTGRGRRDVLFVSELRMPMPTVPGGSTSSSNQSDQASFFREILGLAWQLVVIHEIQFKSTLKDKLHAEWKISSPLSWIHIAGDRIFQITRQLGLDPTAYELTLNVDDQATNRNFHDWSRQDIVRSADRGGMAEEYLFSLLRLAELEHNTLSSNMRPSMIEEILTKRLGLADMVKPTKPPRDWRKDLPSTLNTDKDREEAVVNLCVAVFTELISRRQKAYPCSQIELGNNPTFSTLSYATL